MSDDLSLAKRIDPLSDASLRRYVWWDVFYGLVATGVGVFALVATADLRRKLISVALILAMATWYAAFGRRLIVRREGRRGRESVFLIGIIVLYAPLAIVLGPASLMLIAVAPIAFWLNSHLSASLVIVILNVSSVVGTWIAGREVLSEIVVASLITVYSIMMGTWTRRIIVQSRERAELVAELAASREQIAKLSMEAGIAAERQRVAADIHDTLAQGFGSIVMLAQAVRRSVERDPSAVDGQLELIEQTARDNLAEARVIVTALQPVALESATVAEAIRRLAEGANLRVIGQPRPVPPPVAVVLLRSCQEALTNIRKHTTATNIHIGLNFEEERVKLSITDDGAGFDPDTGAVGFGLSGMRGRASEVGGEMTVVSRPGEGTTVLVEVPA